MKHLLVIFSVWLACLEPAVAQETRIVKDHAGMQVSVPADPQRIVSLHDWTATVMVHELGGKLAGSTGRLDKNGSYYIRSGRELYGLTFDDIAMISVHGMLDFEQISAVKPDLIIGNLGDTLGYRDQLAQIAPILIFDPMNGSPPWENYRDLAGWVNRSAQYEDLKRSYDRRVASLKERMVGASTAPSYAALMPNIESGEIRVMRTYGAQTAVLDDLGFTRVAIMNEVPPGQQEANFSAEIIGRLDADYLFTTHMTDRGADKDSAMAELDQIAPGYRQLLPAARNGCFISMSRFHVYPTTFAAANYVMDRLEELHASDPGRHSSDLWMHKLCGS